MTTMDTITDRVESLRRQAAEREATEQERIREQWREIRRTHPDVAHTNEALIRKFGDPQAVAVRSNLTDAVLFLKGRFTVRRVR
jgi:5'-3' exonuclease